MYEQFLTLTVLLLFLYIQVYFLFFFALLFLCCFAFAVLGLASSRPVPNILFIFCLNRIVGQIVYLVFSRIIVSKVYRI